MRWFTIAEYKSQADLILQQYRVRQLDFIAPDFIHAEVGNIVWKMQRFQNLNSSDAKNILISFQAVPVKLVSTADLLSHAHNIAVKYQRSVYDSLYIALAIREKCQFVTADQKLVNAIGTVLPQVVWLPNWI